MNATMAKFGYPDTLIHEYDRWSVQLRPAQVTLGALVLVCREPATRFGQLSAAAFAELREAVAGAESALSRAFGFERINYLMLMMVDPDVHFHVLPRYGSARTFAGVTFEDAGWPGPPRLDVVNAGAAAVITDLVDEVKSCWPAGAA
ncbi:MAG: HIT family protein [Steroidobacteraceae bacterium]